MDNVSKSKIMETLGQDNYIAASKIAQKLQISEKTLRGRIKELNQELLSYGAQIEMKHGKGYRIHVLDCKQYEVWKKSLIQKNPKHIPTTVRERIEYILLMLLCNKNYIKREMIGEFLYISEKTVSADLKQIEHIFNKYNLLIEKRPGFGMRVVGTEFAKRQCIMNHYLPHNGELKIPNENLDEEIRNIGDSVLSIIRKEELSFTELSIKYLVDYIYVSERRIRHDFVIEDEIPNGISEKNYYLAKNVIEELRKQGVELSLNEAEIGYLAIYLSGNKMFRTEYNGTTNLVIEQSLDDLTGTILESIYMNYQVDLRDNLNLRMFMNKHLLSLDIRMRYCIEIRNPLLQEVKENYFFSYLLAQQAGVVLTNHYGKAVSDDEISYLAMLFEVERLKTKKTIQKVNVLLVCATGKVSANFLLFSIKEKFEKYIDKIELCSIYEFEKQDITTFDYIFSTVPIDISVKIPIIFIRDFMTKNEIVSVQEQMSEQNVTIIRKYFKEELFFKNISGSTKEEVIENMCYKIQKVTVLPEKFCQSVLYREEMGSTDYGNLVAIPHPYQKQFEEDMVCVGILEKPIRWQRNQVQLVIVSAMGNTETERVQFFYEMIAKFINREDLINNILREKTYDSLCKNLQELID